MTDWVADANFSPDGRLLAAGGRGEGVVLWGVATGRKIGEPLRHQNEVVHVAFSPDGDRLASASREATVQLTSLRDREQTPLSIPHDTVVTWVEVSPDSRWLVTMTQEGTARVWDPATGLPLTESMHHAPSLNARAVFNPAGTHVATVGGDHRVLLWALPRYRRETAEILVAVGELVGRYKMVDANRFTVSPLEDWEKLPVPFDRSILLEPQPDH